MLGSPLLGLGDLEFLGTDVLELELASPSSLDELLELLDLEELEDEDDELDDNSLLLVFEDFTFLDFFAVGDFFLS